MKLGPWHKHTVVGLAGTYMQGTRTGWRCLGSALVFNPTKKVHTQLNHQHHLRMWVESTSSLTHVLTLCHANTTGLTQQQTVRSWSHRELVSVERHRLVRALSWGEHWHFKAGLAQLAEEDCKKKVSQPLHQTASEWFTRRDLLQVW